MAKEAAVCSSLLGFYIDRPVNRMGNTGWDARKGIIGYFKLRPEDVARENTACAELIATFALAGLEAEIDEDTYVETEEDRLTELARVFVRNWLIAHPYKRRASRRAS